MILFQARACDFEREFAIMSTRRIVIPARPKSKVSMVVSTVALIIWSLLAVGFISSGTGVLKIVGFVLVVLVIGSWISFANWVFKKRSDLVVDHEAVQFQDLKLYFKDISSIEKGLVQLQKDSFYVKFKTEQRKHEINLMDFQVLPEDSGKLFDAMVEFHRHANAPEPTRTREDPRLAMFDAYERELGKSS